MKIDRLIDRSSDKVDSLAFKLDFLTVSNEELWNSASLIDNLTGFIDLVGSLVVDEDSGGSNAGKEIIKVLLVLALEAVFLGSDFIYLECICNKCGHIS